jgi:hypothetical protein
MRAWFIALVVFGVCLAAIGPWGNYPLNDDWQYARATKLFAESGRIRIDTPIAPALVGQMVLAYPVIRIFGMNHAFLRALTWVIAALCLFCIDRLLTIAGLSWKLRLFTLLTVLFNPLFLYFSNTFMTELYGFAPALLAAVVYFEHRSRPSSNAALCWVAVAVLSIFSFWTRQFAAVVFPTIVVTWLATAARSSRQTRRSWVAMALSCVVFAAGVAGYFWWVRRSGNFGFAFGDPLGRMVEVDFAAWGLETGVAILYLTGFFLPLLLLTLRGRWRALFPYAAGVFLLIGVLLTRSVFRNHAPSDLDFGGWTHHIFPYITNVIFRTGLGPITLDDVYHDPTVARPQWPPQVWVWIERILLAGTILWGFALKGAWRIRAESREKPSLRYEIALFALVWSAASWAITVQAYRLEIFDRYYFPLVLSFSIFLPLLLKVQKNDVAHWDSGVAVICLVALGWFSVAGLHDHFRWNDARWNLVRFASANGVSPANLAGGFEVNGWENYDNVQSQHGQMSPNCRVNYDDFFCLDATYRIGMNVIPGYEEWKQEPVVYWLASGPPVRLLRLTTGK